MRPTSAAAAMFAALLLAAPGAAPQTPPEPCRADAERLCSDRSEPGEIARCLRDHRSDLSDECRARLEDPPAQTQREVAKRFAEACKDDVAAHCADVPRGGLRVIGCLMGHRDELSEACREVLPPER